MAAKKKTEISTAGGVVSVDPAAEYEVKVAHSVVYLGHVIRPRDRNVRLRGDAVLAIAAEVEGAFVSASLAPQPLRERT